MQQLVQDGIARTAKEFSVNDRINEGLQAFQAIRGIMEGALRVAPQAAAAWAIVSLGIEILSNPITESLENRSGIQYVLSQMKWYWNLTDLLLDKSKCEATTAAMQDGLEKGVINLFQKLLLYQMRSIRLYHRNWGVAIAKGMLKTDDWKTQLNDIKEAEETLKRQMDQYNTQENKIWLRSLRETVSALARRHEDENDKRCLSDLHITDPYIEKKNIEEKKGGLLKDSYKWILDHADFQHFRNEIQSGVLWIRGDPGKGKTMLLCGLIDELESSSLAPISYFFCQATGGSRLDTATSVLRGLIYHLARRNPQLTKYVRQKYDYKNNIFSSQEDPWHDLCEITTAMLNDPTLENTVLIVDALDECSVGLQRLLNFIIVPSRAKWVVSSRNWPDIEEKLGNGDQKSKIHLELNQHSVSKAVESYIASKVEYLSKSKGYDGDMKNAVLDYLTANADGTFLWVALLHALVKELKPCGQKEVEDIIASCGSFLTLHNGFVNFVHLSAKDYLRSEASDKMLPYGIAQRHQTIFERSLDILGTTLKRDIYYLEKPGYLIDNVSAPDPDPLASIKYSCLSWIDHFEDSAEHGLTSGEDKILSFFKNDYLHWLEALSLLKSVSEAGRAIAKLQAYLQNKASQDLQDIIKDARLFLLSHGGIIEGAPLQVYISALIFSPTNSLTRQHFIHEQPSWIELNSGVEENWNACLQTLKGHGGGVTSVVFSNDGQRLASGSGDKTVKIWDGTSGTCLQTLEGHGHWVTSVVFSNDGQRLASGSGDKTVKIWDGTSGTCLQTLEGHENGVTSVVFSNDRQQLASGSFEKTATPTTPSIHQTSLFSPHFYRPTLNTDSTWIMKDGQRIIYLPLNYRPRRQTFIAGKRLALFRRSRRPIVIALR
ncbi:Vegetative incompatibility protein HET-E-1 [Ceratocystis lukuohia]|uniref:Vegetative incompatibility protein HET-E-1 n=1 Tax=Ceratocystis lukuohia TaxID=2019550 RepID=A0ABR4MMH5_9PEZI